MSLFLPMLLSPLHMSLRPGAEVLVLGKGPVMLLAAKLAALRGYRTTCAVTEELRDGTKLLYNEHTPAGSLPLTLLPASPATPGFDREQAYATIAAAEGVVIAFDELNAGQTALDASVLDTWLNPGRSSVQHISLMSRFCNGDGSRDSNAEESLDSWRRATRSTH